MLLRDIIDLEATYAGPDAKNNMATPSGSGVPGALGLDGPAVAATAATPLTVVPPQRRAAVGAARATRSSRSERPTGDGEEGEGGETPPGDGDFDDDDMEGSLSLAAIEAELKPKVVETFDTVADSYKRLRRLQDQDIQFRLKSESLSPAQERKYKKLKEEIIAEVKSLGSTRPASTLWSSSSTTSTSASWVTRAG